MARHDLKIQPTFLDAILAGDKTFELRQDDRGYRVGDTLRLFDGERRHDVLVTYVLFGWGLLPGWVCMAIKEADDGDVND